MVDPVLLSAKPLLQPTHWCSLWPRLLGVSSASSGWCLKIRSTSASEKESLPLAPWIGVTSESGGWAWVKTGRRSRSSLAHSRFHTSNPSSGYWNQLRLALLVTFLLSHTATAWLVNISSFCFLTASDMILSISTLVKRESGFFGAGPSFRFLEAFIGGSNSAGGFAFGPRCTNRPWPLRQSR